MVPSAWIELIIVLVMQVLSAAVTRYERMWLPLVVEEDARANTLVPPVDVAWVWHLHRLAPLKYAAFCRERFGRIVDPGKSAFRLQCTGNGDDGGTEAIEARASWAR